jgi:hypothetical protein
MYENTPGPQIGFGSSRFPAADNQSNETGFNAAKAIDGEHQRLPHVVRQTLARVVAERENSREKLRENLRDNSREIPGEPPLSECKAHPDVLALHTDALKTGGLSTEVLNAASRAVPLLAVVKSPAAQTPARVDRGDASVCGWFDHVWTKRPPAPRALSDAPLLLQTIQLLSAAGMHPRLCFWPALGFALPLPPAALATSSQSPTGFPAQVCVALG